MSHLINSLLFCFISGTWADITLKETGGEAKTPGDEIRLTCTVSGFSLSTDDIHWLRQPQDRSLHWLGAVWKSGDTLHVPSVMKRVAFARDISKGEAYMRLTGLQPGDSGVYYCARGRYSWSRLDYWGQGTFVTVTTVSDTTPSVFPVSPCCSAMKEGIVNIGCHVVTRGYPASIVMEASSGPVTTGVKIYQPVCTKDNITFISYASMEVPACDLDIKNYKCKVGNHSKVITVPECGSQELSQPTMYSNDAAMDKTEILCVIDKHNPKKISVAWFVGDKPLQETNTFSTLKTAEGFYRTQSSIMIKNDEWLSGETFTCKATVGKISKSQKISGCPAKQCMCPPP